MPATPPTTPPAIAPVSVESPEDVDVDDGAPLEVELELWTVDGSLVDERSVLLGEEGVVSDVAEESWVTVTLFSTVVSLTDIAVEIDGGVLSVDVSEIVTRPPA